MAAMGPPSWSRLYLTVTTEVHFPRSKCARDHLSYVIYIDIIYIYYSYYVYSYSSFLTNVHIYIIYITHFHRYSRVLQRNGNLYKSPSDYSTNKLFHLWGSTCVQTLAISQQLALSETKWSSKIHWFMRELSLKISIVGECTLW